MKKIFSLILVGAVVLMAQTYPTMNFTGYGDTSYIGGFRADSLKFSKPIAWNNENKLFFILADDTSSAVRSGDSIKIQWGYQIGFMYRGISGVYTQAWGNKIVVDTISSLTAGNLYKGSAGTGAAAAWVTGSDDVVAPVYGQVDTSGTLSFMQWHSVVAPWAPLVRIWVKGLAGNKLASFVKVIVGVEQRGWSVTRTQ